MRLSWIPLQERERESEREQMLRATTELQYKLQWILYHVNIVMCSGLQSLVIVTTSTINVIVYTNA